MKDSRSCEATGDTVPGQLRAERPAHAASARQCRFWFALAFLLVALLGLWKTSAYGWNRPDPPGDSQDYFTIAINLSIGRGFSYDWDDPRWREPYERNNQSGEFSTILSRHGRGPIAYRPPAVPILMAVVYSLTGDHFFLAWRLVDTLLLALAAGTAATLARRMAHPIAAATTVGLCLLDSTLRLHVPRVLTEGTAIFVVMMLVYVILSLRHQKRMRLVVAAGLLTGFLIMVRSIFICWLAGLPFLILACWRSQQEATLRDSLKAAVVYVGIAIAVIVPWAVRNCVVLDAFMPLGTQGGQGLPAGYSDLTWGHRGNWSDDSLQRLWAQYLQTHDVSTLSPLQQQRCMAEVGQASVIAWLRNNWRSLPLLAVVKAQSEWTGWHPGKRAVAFALVVLLSLFDLRRNPDLWVLWFLVLLNFATIMVTYSDGGRFLVPVILLFYILVGVGIQVGIRIASGLGDRIRARPVWGVRR